MTFIKSDNPLKLGIKSTMSLAVPRTLFDLIPHYRGFSLTECHWIQLWKYAGKCLNLYGSTCISVASVYLLSSRITSHMPSTLAFPYGGPKLPHRIKVGNKSSHVNLFPIRFPGKGRTERSRKYTVQDRYSTVPGSWPRDTEQWTSALVGSPELHSRRQPVVVST